MCCPDADGRAGQHCPLRTQNVGKHFPIMHMAINIDDAIVQQKHEGAKRRSRKRPHLPPPYTPAVPRVATLNTAGRAAELGTLQVGLRCLYRYRRKDKQRANVQVEDSQKSNVTTTSKCPPGRVCAAARRNCRPVVALSTIVSFAKKRVHQPCHLVKSSVSCRP